MGANPVQVEVGEFEEPTEDVEEIVAESESLFPCPAAFPFWQAETPSLPWVGNLWAPQTVWDSFGKGAG